MDAMVLALLCIFLVIVFITLVIMGLCLLIREVVRKIKGWSPTEEGKWRRR